MELKVGNCPHCGAVSELTFRIPIYGNGGAEIKCTICGAMMRDTNYTEHNFTEGGYATPTTSASAIACIERCIERWNRRVVSNATD